MSPPRAGADHRLAARQHVEHCIGEPKRTRPTARSNCATIRRAARPDAPLRLLHACDRGDLKRAVACSLDDPLFISHDRARRVHAGIAQRLGHRYLVKRYTL